MCWDWKDGERSLRRAKSGETPVEASSDTDAQIVCYTPFLVRKTNQTISQLVLSAVSLRIAGVEQLSLESEGFQESGTCCSRPIFKLLMGKFQEFLW